MKVFDLQCQHGHVFEGWFRSRENFDQQIEQGLLQCPVCSSAQIERKLTAARINTGAKEPTSAPSTSTAASAVTPSVETMQSQAIKQLRALVRQTEDVGARFAQEARRMHEGDIEARAIRGQATQKECLELLEDGVELMPIPAFLDDDRLQ
ncbi:DUF1178 family protein [Alcaligenes endophyticus]|uniref:DUF1178 family protein n=1 Tax=Alcaligenes endophyticus TaxID=1929088 RepID=A0ABT8EN92_9BURK|nr:DUF1178 family protein [Alcaligenes endophyticus]MCX5591386.1 DUF1178 family protein [Alcaligenes endophyticus]MDN4122733.1 DUF1178 family protein [Alcaligenes endophyticus]